MKNNTFSRLKLAAVLVCFVCACALFTGCGPKTKPASVYGTWKSQYDGYTISETQLVYDDGGYGFDFTAEVVEVTDSYIYVKKAAEDYYCVHYKDLTDKSCSFANAFKIPIFDI